MSDHERAKAGMFAMVLALLAGDLDAQGDGTLRWAYSTQGAIVSSAAVANDGTIYVGSEGRRLWAIRPDGSTQWYWPAVPDGPQLTTDWFDAAPAIGADGTVYVGNFDGRFYAISAAGTLRWSFDTGAYIISSAAIGADGTIYFGAGDGNLYAVNPDGTQRWAFAAGDWVDSSPAIGSDGTIYFGSWDRHVYAVTPEGNEKWAVETGDAVVSSPALGPDGVVYIGSSDTKLYAISPAGVVQWTFATEDVIDASPVVGPDGTIYFGSSDGYFHALQPDGTPAWPQPFFVGQGVFGGAVIRADGTILFGASDRRVYALNANGTLQWTLATGDMVDAAPAMGEDGTIYVGSYDQKLYAIHGNGSALGNGSWTKFRRDRANQGRAPASGAVLTPPEIITAPQSQAIDYGTSVTLSVTVAGTQPFSYQWLKDGLELADATGASWVMDAVTESDAGSYRVRVSNTAGTAFSAAAVLTVNPPVAPVIVKQPRPLTLIPGNRLSLWVEATGSAPLAYQWFKYDVAIAGAVAPYYEVDACTSENAGVYTVIVSNAGGTRTSAPATVKLADAPPAQLVNLSTRALVGSGDSILIAGFVIKGTGARRLLVRAVGPTLAESPFKVPGVLADPVLTIYAGQTPVWTNDNWGAAPNALAIDAAADAVFAFELDPESLDAAALVELAPGLYTAHMSGVSATTGVALCELYDAGAVTVDASRLVNISARAETMTGADILIAGFAISGAAAKTVLIRAVGPKLGEPPFNVPGVLADPMLRVFQGPTEILTNNDWADGFGEEALFASMHVVGAFSLEPNSADAAVLAVLMPGTYTAHAIGSDGATGNVLIEVYEVQ